MAYVPVPDGAIALRRRDGDLYVSWSTSDPAGTWYQLYADGQLAYRGTGRSCALPLDGNPLRIDVGSVASLADAQVDYGAALPSLPPQRASLTWTGGSYLKPSIAGFLVQLLAGYGSGPYGSGGYGGSVLATVPAYMGGRALDGYGLGGYGAGTYGYAAAAYAWTSPRLPRGTQVLAVIPFDAAGNAQGSPQLTSVTIAAPPQPPGALAVSYSAATHAATLSWTGSPL
jgi:hypothetical protein